MPEAQRARNDITTLLDKADTAENSGNLEKALALCVEALASAPEEIRLRCCTAALLRQQGKPAEAEQLLREGLAQQPESVSLTRDLAKTLAAQARYDEAVELARDLIWPLRKDTPFRVAYAEWLVRLGEKKGGTPLDRLAALWNELDATEKAIEDEWLLELEVNRKPASPPVAPNPAYVQSLFDCYAEGFDEHMAQLAYNAPKVLRKAIDHSMPARSGLDIVDLGCGTGMMGEAVKSLAYSLTGIDCSPRMISRAGRRGIYDQLIQGDIVAALETMPQADLVTATDVFIYIGDLKEVFIQIARVLRADGGFAATIEKAAEGAEKPGYVLQKSRRYAHSESYIRRLAAASMLDILAMESFVMRREGKTGIEALAFVVGKKG